MKNPNPTEEAYQDLLRRLEVSVPATVRQMIIRLLSGDLEAPAPRICGKFPTGPGCYAGEPVKAKPAPTGTPAYVLQLAHMGRKYNVSEETREIWRENGRRRGQSGKAGRMPDMADLAVVIYPEGRMDR